MSKIRFSVFFILLLILQLVLTRYCLMGPYVYICILPAMILCMPTSLPTPWTLAVAFLSGLVVDGLADGPLGLNAASLLAVALLQKTLISVIIDEDIVERNYNFSFHANGIIKVGLTLTLEILVYLTIYVFLDGAGLTSFSFNVLKVLISTPICLIFGSVVINILSPYQRK